jgi:hypothetical protein
VRNPDGGSLLLAILVVFLLGVYVTYKLMCYFVGCV